MKFPARIGIRSVLVFCGLVGILSWAAWASPPPWWTTRDVLNSGDADDYAAVNQGQLKNIAAKAAAEMNEKIPGGAGSTINDLVEGWATPGSSTDDYSVVNIGQLKNLAKPFYLRLMAVGYTSAYPWTTTTGDDNDYAVANIGQVKHVFGFDFDITEDGDSLPDWWETYYGWDASGSDQNNNGIQDGLDDFDGDGISNATEFANNTDPTNAGSATSPPSVETDSSGENALVLYSPLLSL